MSNASTNAAAIDKYRDELRAMLGDISQIDKTVLSRAVNAGLADVKKNTPVGQYPAGSGKIGGTMRKGWNSPSIQPSGGGIQKAIENPVEYSSFVNDGHRIVNRQGETIGYWEGYHMLERANNVVERDMIQEFDAEIKRVKEKHGG